MDLYTFIYDLTSRTDLEVRPSAYGKMDFLEPGFAHNKLILHHGRIYFTK